MAVAVSVVDVVVVVCLSGVGVAVVCGVVGVDVVVVVCVGCCVAAGGVASSIQGLWPSPGGESIICVAMIDPHSPRYSKRPIPPSTMSSK